MILIDTREPETYQKLGRPVYMEWGDAAIIANERVIRVERKTPTDLMSSVESDRFNAQLAHVDEIIIVDEDKWMPRKVWDELYTNDRLRKTVNTLTERIPVKLAVSIADYGNILKNIEQKLLDNTYATTRVHARVDVSYDTPEIGFIAGIPGIGEELAKRIVIAYPEPINAIMNMPTWNQSVEGVGKKKVDDAIKFMLKLKKEVK